jgi:hypothetical protein
MREVRAAMASAGRAFPFAGCPMARSGRASKCPPHVPSAPGRPPSAGEVRSRSGSKREPEGQKDLGGGPAGWITAAAFPTIGGTAVTMTICERCGRRSLDSAIHDDLYHPVARPKPTDPAPDENGTEEDRSERSALDPLPSP